MLWKGNFSEIEFFHFLDFFQTQIFKRRPLIFQIEFVCLENVEDVVNVIVSVNVSAERVGKERIVELRSALHSACMEVHWDPKYEYEDDI